MELLNNNLKKKINGDMMLHYVYPSWRCKCRPAHKEDTLHLQ